MESEINEEQQVYLNGILINFIDLINENNIMSALSSLNVEDIDPNIISPKFDKTPLMLACKKGQMSIVNSLASLQGCNFYITNSKGRNCLTYTVKYAHLELIKLLTQNYRIDDTIKIINYHDDEHYNINMLLISVLTNNEEIVSYFLKDGFGNINPNETDSCQNTPLLLSIERGFLNIVDILLKDHRTDPNQGNELFEFQDSPLIYACYLGLYEIASLLLSHIRIDLNLSSKHGLSPLMICIEFNNLELISLLLSHPNIDINYKCPFEKSALFYACSINNKEAINLMIQHQDIEIEDSILVQDAIREVF